MKTIIYDGEGVSHALRPALIAQFPRAKFLTANDLFKQDWEEVALFILPGGRDRPYHAALAGPLNQRIRSFVEKGGTFFGICAGAYYGCALVDFDRGLPLAVVEERELRFFEGSAVGPAYGLGTFDYHSTRGARAALLQTANGSFRAHYNGGPSFQGDLSKVKVLATYAELPHSPPAIIECPTGRGKAILSGVHLEMSPPFLDANLASHLPLLLASEQMRSQFLREVLP